MIDIKILTIFPGIFDSFLAYGNPARAVEAGLMRAQAVDLRNFTDDRHRTTDDYPYGGGTGMVMKPEPVVRGIGSLRGQAGDPKVILMTPQGRLFSQTIAEELAQEESIVLVCGRYEGIDERIRNFVDDEISVGDYILSGGETAAMVLIDAVVRLIPGVLGKDSHIEGESFYLGILEYPQYTRPRVFEDLKVPEVLLEGHHEKIRSWRKKQALARTLARRPDLLKRRVPDAEEKRLLEEIRSEIHTGLTEKHYEHARTDSNGTNEAGPSGFPERGHS
ncbi:MAG: tRNA (guanosine(37)-N1)-methyltransferase TrmD [Desulfomonile tiedjei]|uniref:tRNA (guanine-N(1)-)-methyltransferase n=1 Tax=Desulfomonile tiedjei TaxID=2358 RepID=A0A9D6V4N5_9BACT|nr:tRNA (guanosine(37)-N1)-methyltransferase TrmD [Desulfomonile tiedjei]